MIESKPVDIVIAGGGPVGAALAASLRDTGLDVVLVDPHVPPRARGGEAGQSQPLRPIALSHGSRLILERLGVFERIAATPIATIHVSQCGGFGRTLMKSGELDVPALGYVADFAAVSAELFAAASAMHVRGRFVRQESIDERVRTWVDVDGREHAYDARLLVLADGGRGDENPTRRDYRQSAVVARVHTEVAPKGIAWERFTPSGPIALLPFADAYALVWTVPQERAEQLLALPAPAFCDALHEVFGDRLGRFSDAEMRYAYPLALRFRADTVAAPRTLAIGNAAQTLHPVAGQGLNLGLRDAVELVDLIRASTRDAIGSTSFLSRARAQRRLDRYATIGMTDTLITVFSGDDAPRRFLRGCGLAALDLLPPLRRFLARRMIFGARALP